VTDIKIVNKDLVLSTMGRGFWILSDVTPLHELNARIAAADAHLFKSRPAFRLWDFDFEEFPRPPEPDAPQYPPVGVNLSYWLARGGSPLKLEILDAAGKLVRELSSDAAGEAIVDAEPGMREWRLERIGTPRLPNAPGLNRFTWDLRYAGPWSPLPDRTGRRGPMVPPGTYSARLSVGGAVQSTPIEVRLDPRVVKEGVTVADTQAQAELALKSRDALSRARSLVVQLDKLVKAATPGSEAEAKLLAVQREVATVPIRYSRPMLADQLEYLYANLNRADQRPGQDAAARYEELQRALDAQLDALARAKP
jgi:hypothetical protein